MSVEKENKHPHIPLQEKVRFLLRPESYPERPRQVEYLETHMSCVFFVGPFVYKLKKPVRYDFLDYTAPEARHHFCNEELRLNRRLAAPVYLDVVPLVAAPAGNLSLSGSGRVADWLVRMQRLPPERMLDRAIRNRTVTEDDIRAVIYRLVRFYRSVPVSMGPEAYLRRLALRSEENRAQLTLPAFGLPDGQVARIYAAQHELLARRPELFAARAAGNLLVEGHGDLRPEHVWLGPPEPMVIDCLEFQREFRIIDPVEELAFLSMECELLGDRDTGRLLLAAYGEAAGDRPPEALVSFYKSYRAGLRAKIALWHIGEVKAAAADSWRQRARDYLGLAEAYAGRFG
jgi:aminoglycoside phosphotransferase family enzyme